MTGKDVINKAYELRNCVYWYGGKRQKCTQSLLNEFAKSYPNIYTNTYITKCKADIKNNETCCDCSGLVSYAMQIPDIGSYYFYDKYPQFREGTPKDGMMLYKKGHIALYNKGYVVEMRGVDYDFTDTRKYNKSEWICTLYDPNIDYDEKPTYTEGWNHDKHGWWYADTNHTYLKDGYFTVPWSGNPNGSKFYFDKNGYCITTDQYGVIKEPV